MLWGAGAGRSKVSPLILLTSTFGFHPDGARICPSRPNGIPSLYVFEGSGSFRDTSQPFGVLTEKEIDGVEIVTREPTGNRSLVEVDRGDEVIVQAGESGLFPGSRCRSPWPGTGRIVMNSQAELNKALRELKDGTFIKKC
jgi:quercetin 2,3-dioxygenase